MASDPSNFVTNPPTTVVKVINTSRNEMNGQLGIVTGYSTDRARYLVHMVSSQTTTALKPENLERGSTFEKYQAQYLQVRNDPRLRQQFQNVYSKVHALTGVKPEFVGAAILASLAVFAYFFGLVKTMTFLSLVVLLATIVAPDLINFVSVKEVARNFPSRSREMLEQVVPAARGRISNRLALAIVVIFVAFVGRSLVLSTPKRVEPDIPLAQPRNLDKRERLYKLGYEDALANKPYGEALAKDGGKKTPRGLSEGQDFSYQELPTQRKRGFGYGTALSAFFVFRTVKDLGRTAEGGFDVHLALANAQTMEIWKKAIVAFSVYNIVRSFI